ncbi:hypothetical protein [Pseudomonas marginalis]|nr:hypothetical protein F3K50_16240 [Pseudomonas marginalis]
MNKTFKTKSYKNIALSKKYHKDLSVITVVRDPLRWLIIKASANLLPSTFQGKQKMINSPESNKNRSQDNDIKHDIKIIIDPKKPLGRTTVTGEFSPHGSLGRIEVEYTHKDLIYTLKAIRYMCANDTGLSRNPKFIIKPMLIQGPELSFTPVKDGQWHAWGASGDYITSQPSLFVAFTFIFDSNPDGASIVDSQTLLLTA